MGTIQSTSAQAIEKILFQILASMHMLKLNNYVCTLYQYCPRKYAQNTTLPTLGHFNKKTKAKGNWAIERKKRGGNFQKILTGKYV